MTIQQVVEALLIAGALVLAALLLLGSFGLQWLGQGAKLFGRGLRTLRSKRFSLAQVLTWTVLVAIWMAITRNFPPLMFAGCAAMGAVAIMHLGMQQPE